MQNFVENIDHDLIVQCTLETVHLFSYIAGGFLKRYLIELKYV